MKQEKHMPTELRHEGADLIRRCKWCIERIGRPRYNASGQWQTVPENWFHDPKFTDGLCADCFAEQKAKILHETRD